MLDLFITGWNARYRSGVKELKRLDEHIQSSNSSSSLRQVIFRYDDYLGDKGWAQFVRQVEKCMPYCVEKGMIEFIK